MMRHTLAAKQMFSGSGYPGLDMAMDIGVAHHERWDGAGYPLGTKGAETPLVARIVAVAHVYDALVTDKPYRPAMRPEEALQEIKRQAGYAFDPEVVAAFVRRMEGPRSESSQLEGTAVASN
jgi:putative two-component system response regulator